MQTTPIIPIPYPHCCHRPETVGLASNLGFMILILTLVKRKPEHLIMSFCARVRIDLMDCENVTFSIRTVIAGCHLR
jgi:hypothetical protein